MLKSVRLAVELVQGTVIVGAGSDPKIIVAVFVNCCDWPFSNTVGKVFRIVLKVIKGLARMIESVQAAVSCARPQHGLVID